MTHLNFMCVLIRILSGYLPRHESPQHGTKLDFCTAELYYYGWVGRLEQVRRAVLHRPLGFLSIVPSAQRSL